ncbi:MAG TPA: uroporphyrinogen-III synthase [Nitrososphaeraceae archaeon]|nr:uroporphyrinogen-III synthase [Nitrososphaeraceae archaeon]
MTIAITASRRATELAHIIKSFGGRPYLAPTIGIEADLKKPKEDVLKFLDKAIAGEVDYAVFMTAPGIFSLFTIAKRLGLEEKLIYSLSKLQVFARSLKPATALQKHGIKVSMIPEENTARGISSLLITRGVIGKRIAILWHGDYPQQLREELYKAGAKSVIEASTYRYSINLKEEGASVLKSMGYHYVVPSEKRVIRLIHDIVARKIDSITFTSPPSVHDLIKIAQANGLSHELKKSLNTDVVIVAVGPSTKNALEENDITVDVMPQVAKMGPMVKALDEYISTGNGSTYRTSKKN